MLFLWYPKCTTCQKAKAFLDERGVSYEARDIKLENPTAEELRGWWEKSGMPLKKFFNTSGLQYKALGLKDKLPEMSEEEQLALLATDGMLVKRPILVDANIRELCEDFIEIVELEHEHNFAGRIDGSVWHCRRWTEWKRVEQYQNTGEKNFEEFDARNVGNIFDSFNSFTYFGNFLPQEDFPFLTFSPTEEEKKHYAAYYDITVPKTFRGGKAS